MIAKRYEELDAWQVADELRREVFALTETGPASRDFTFRDQIRDAVSSAARNIAEGFGRFRPADFARFMEFSLSSTMETQDLITDGIERKYFRLATTERVRKLAQRSLQISRALTRYLKSCRKRKLPFHEPPPISIEQPKLPGKQRQLSSPKANKPRTNPNDQR